MSKSPKVVVLLFLAAFALAALSGCGGYKNNTPVDAAKLWVKAMVTHDTELMKYINHSSMPMFPPERCMEIATESNWGQYDVSKFQYKDLGNGEVEVTNPKGGKTILKMVQEGDKWFFTEID